MKLEICYDKVSIFLAYGFLCQSLITKILESVFIRALCTLFREHLSLFVNRGCLFFIILLYIFYIFFNFQDYSIALKYVKRLLGVEPGNHQAKDLELLIQQKLKSGLRLTLLQINLIFVLKFSSRYSVLCFGFIVSEVLL